MNDYKVGDIVQLKSGGPKMTVVAAVPQAMRISCQWFAGSKLESGTFLKEAIVKVDDSEKKKASQ